MRVEAVGVGIPQKEGNVMKVDNPSGFILRDNLSQLQSRETVARKNDAEKNKATLL